MKNNDRNQDFPVPSDGVEQITPPSLSLKDPRDFTRFFFNSLFVRDQLFAGKLARALTERWARGISEHPYDQVEYLQKNCAGIIPYQDFVYGFFGDYLFKIISDEHYEIISAGTESRYEEIISDLYSKLLNPENFALVVERTFASASAVMDTIKANSRRITKLLFSDGDLRTSAFKKQNGCDDLYRFDMPRLEDYDLPRCGFSLSDLPELKGNYDFASVLEWLLVSPRKKWNFYEAGRELDNVLPDFNKFIQLFQDFPCAKNPTFVQYKNRFNPKKITYQALPEVNEPKFEDRIFAHFLSRLQAAAEVFLAPEARKDDLWSQEEVNDPFAPLSEFKLRALISPLFSALFNQSAEEKRAIFTAYKQSDFSIEENLRQREEIIALFKRLAPDYAKILDQSIKSKANGSVKNTDLIASAHIKEGHTIYLEYLPSTATAHLIFLEGGLTETIPHTKTGSRQQVESMFGRIPRLKISVSDGGEKNHSPLAVSFTLFEQTLNAFIDLVYGSFSEEEKSQFPAEIYPFYRILVRKKLASLFDAVVGDSQRIFSPDFLQGWNDILHSSVTFKNSLSGPAGTVFDSAPFILPEREENPSTGESDCYESDVLEKIEILKKALTTQEEEFLCHKKEGLFSHSHKKKGATHMFASNLLTDFWRKKNTENTDGKRSTHEIFFRDPQKLRQQINFTLNLRHCKLANFLPVNFDILLENFQVLFAEFSSFSLDTYAVRVYLSKLKSSAERESTTQAPILISKEGIPCSYYFLAGIINELGLEFLDQWTEKSAKGEDGPGLELIDDWRRSLAENNFSLADFTAIKDGDSKQQWYKYWKELYVVHRLQSLVEGSDFLRAVLPESFFQLKVDDTKLRLFEKNSDREKKGETRYLKKILLSPQQKSGVVDAKVHAVKNFSLLKDQLLNFICFTPHSPGAPSQDFLNANFTAHAPILAADFLDPEKGQLLINLIKVIDEDRSLERDSVNQILADLFVNEIFPPCLADPAKRNLLLFFLLRLGLFEQIYASGLDDNRVYYGIAGGSFSITLWLTIKNRSELLKNLQIFLREVLNTVPLEEIVDDQGRFIVT